MTGLAWITTWLTYLPLPWKQNNWHDFHTSYLHKTFNMGTFWDTMYFFYEKMINYNLQTAHCHTESQLVFSDWSPSVQFPTQNMLEDCLWHTLDHWIPDTKPSNIERNTDQKLNYLYLAVFEENIGIGRQISGQYNTTSQYFAKTDFYWILHTLAINVV